MSEHTPTTQPAEPPESEPLERLPPPPGVPDEGWRAKIEAKVGHLSLVEGEIIDALERIEKLCKEIKVAAEEARDEAKAAHQVAGFAREAAAKAADDAVERVTLCAKHGATLERHGEQLLTHARQLAAKAGNGKLPPSDDGPPIGG